MPRWPTVVGIALGLALGFTVLAVLDRRGAAPTGPILSECDGRLRAVVVHYEPGAKEIAGPVYRDLLPALPAEVTVHVICPSRQAFAELTGLVGPTRCRLNLIPVNHPITTWSRDRWILLAPSTLFSPRAEAAGEIWPARAGDERVADDIAAALRSGFVSRRSDLYFDGGDFLADSENVFVAPRILTRNIQHTVRDQAELLDKLAGILKRRVLLLDGAPDHHVGMYLTALPGRRVLVAEGALFDAVARQCESAGYAVTRLPIVTGNDGRSYLTYNNVLLDGRTVCLPSYRQPDAPNEAARAVWEKLGYEVKPVDCTSASRHFGSLHCLVNVLRRSSP